MFKVVKKSAAVALIAAVAAGCENKTQSGALIGGLSGAAVGGLIGSNSHARAGEGAAIGAVAGVLGGALIGHGMDKADERKAREEKAAYQDTRRSAYAYEAPAASPRVTQRDVIDWSDRGVKDEVIVDRIERSGQVFHVTAADENDLRDKGVSSDVIRAMKNTARK